eukprot:TCONS_00010596-protein
MNKPTETTPTIRELRTIYTNADQMTSKKKNELLKTVIAEQPHIIAITEVNTKRVSERKDQDYSFENYSTPYKTNIGMKKRRGIIILVHNSIEQLILQIETKIRFEEVCLIEIEMQNKDTMLFGCFYRSPTKTETNDYDENNNNMNKLIRDLCLNPKYTHLCLVGDFNYGKIDWKHWSSPCEE